MNKRKIKADAKGKFSAWARGHGMTVQEAANRILRNSSQYSPTLIKRAQFARNASKWADGGIMGSPATNSVVKNNLWTPQTRLSIYPELAKRGLLGKGQDSVTMQQWREFTPDQTLKYVDPNKGIDTTMGNTGNPGGIKYWSMDEVDAVNGRSIRGSGFSDNYLQAKKKSGFSKGGQFTLPKYSTGGNIFKTIAGAGITAAGILGTPFTGGASLAGTAAGIQMMGAGVQGFGDDANAKQNAETGALVNAQNMADAGQAGIGSNYPKIFNKGGMFKGKKFGFKKGGATAIVGGGELVMSPDGVLTSMKGPTDMGGGKGIPVDMPDGTMIINKKDSKNILPLAGKINKNKQILEGGGSMLSKNSSKKNLNKYYSKVLDVYNKQEAKKFADGGKFYEGGGYGKWAKYHGLLSPNMYADNPYSFKQGIPVDPRQNSVGFENLSYPGSYNSQNNPYGLDNVNVVGNKPNNGIQNNYNPGSYQFNSWENQNIPQNYNSFTGGPEQYQGTPDWSTPEEAGFGNGNYTPPKKQTSNLNTPRGSDGSYRSNAITDLNSRVPTNGTGYVAPDELMNIPNDYGSLINDAPSNIKFSNPQHDPSSSEFVGAAGAPQDTNWLNTLGELAPTIYNAAQGIFGKRQHMNANDYRNPYEGQINSLMANRRYNIDPSLAANEATFRTTAANMRNLGGSRGQVMSNLTGAQNTKQFGDMSAYSQKNNMDNQYRAEQAQTLYPLGRDTAMTNMAVDDSNMMTDASGRNMLGSSMTGLQQYLLTKRQMKGQEKREKMLAGAIRAYGSGYANKWLGPEFSNYRG